MDLELVSGIMEVAALHSPEIMCTSCLTSCYLSHDLSKGSLSTVVMECTHVLPAGVVTKKPCLYPNPGTLTTLRWCEGMDERLLL